MSHLVLLVFKDLKQVKETILQEHNEFQANNGLGTLYFSEEVSNSSY